MLTTTVVAAAAVGVTQGDDWGWGSPATLTMFGVVAVAGPLLVRRARHDPDALLDAESFSVRSFSIATVVSMLSQAGFFAFFFSIPLFLIDVWGWSTWQAGVAVAVNQAASAVVGLPAGRRADRAGPVGVVVVGGVIAAAGYGWLAIDATVEPDLWGMLLPAFVLAGVGSMMIGGTISAAAFHDIDDRGLGRAAAAYYVTRRLGSAAGGVAAVAILGDRIGDDSLTGFRGIWGFATGCYLLAALAMAVGFRGSGRRAG